MLLSTDNDVYRTVVCIVKSLDVLQANSQVVNSPSLDSKESCILRAMILRTNKDKQIHLQIGWRMMSLRHKTCGLLG